MVVNVVEDHVVTLVALREIFFRVIDDVIGADRSDKIDIARAANRRNLRAKKFGDLNGERSDTSSRAVNENLLPGLNISLAQTLQRNESGQRQGGCLFKGDVRRLQDQCSFASACILGQTAATEPEH